MVFEGQVFHLLDDNSISPPKQKGGKAERIVAFSFFNSSNVSNIRQNQEFPFKICRKATKWLNNITGTTKEGSQLKGNFKIATLGWSNANC